LKIPLCPQGQGFLAAASSLLRPLSSPSRCALGPQPGPGPSLQHSPATPRGPSQFYLQSNWRATAHLHPLVPNVSWDPLPTQRDQSISPCLGLILTGTQVCPRRTHPHNAMNFLYRDIAARLPRHGRTAGKRPGSPWEGTGGIQEREEEAGRSSVLKD